MACLVTGFSPSAFRKSLVTWLNRWDCKTGRDVSYSNTNWGEGSKWRKMTTTKKVKQRVRKQTEEKLLQFLTLSLSQCNIGFYCSVFSFSCHSNICSDITWTHCLHHLQDMLNIKNACWYQARDPLLNKFCEKTKPNKQLMHPTNKFACVSKAWFSLFICTIKLHCCVKTITNTSESHTVAPGEVVPHYEKYGHCIYKQLHTLSQYLQFL